LRDATYRTFYSDSPKSITDCLGGAAELTEEAVEEAESVRCQTRFNLLWRAKITRCEETKKIKHGEGRRRRPARTGLPPS
jgi:hypothetical protein